MSNVVRFKKAIAKPSNIDSATLCAAITAFKLMPGRVSEIRNAQAELKEDIRVTILMIDLAVMRARQWAGATEDPRIKRDIEDHLASIEGLLEITRQKAQAL